MKKILTTLSIAALLALGIGGLAACSDNNNQNGFDALTTDTEIFGFSAASAGMIISSMNETQTAEAQNVSFAKSYAKTYAETTADTTTTATTDTQTVDELNDYMTLVENLLGSGGYNFTENTSDNPDYEIKLTVSCSAITGSFEYVMYYNETLVSETTEQDKGETETEQVYKIEGVLMIDETSYPLSGVKETSTEVENGETETETERKLTVTLSDTSKIIVKQETSRETGEYEQEYTYSVYENNILTKSCAFSYEQETDETEIEMVYKTLNASGTLDTQIFFFEKETEHGKEVIKIKVGSNTSAATYTVSIETDEDGNNYYTYTLQDGSAYNKKRG